MNSKLFIISIVVILVLMGLTWYVVIALRSSSEQEIIINNPIPAGGNQNTANVVEDTVDSITSDFNKATDDLTATAELNTLEEQLNNF